MPTDDTNKTTNYTAIADTISTLLSEQADLERSEKMAAYMKTTMPFYGVQAGPRTEIMRPLWPQIQVASHQDYEALILTLWNRPHREEKYIAVRIARRFRKFIDFQSLPLYERLIREGAWWDFVDETASHLVGGVLAKNPEKTWPVLDAWINDPDMWIRRTALLAQLRRKEQTDQETLFRYCLACADEKEFFIRKAIGWALREYADTNPTAVRDFLDFAGHRFSPLTIREASKRL